MKQWLDKIRNDLKFKILANQLERRMKHILKKKQNKLIEDLNLETDNQHFF